MKKLFLAIGLLLAIAGSALWIYLGQFAAPKFNVSLHRAVGRVMAEETANLVDSHGRIVVIAIDTPKTPELRVQIEEFEKALKPISGIRIEKTYMLDTEDKPKYGTGSGISARRFVRIVNKNTTVDAIVSFVGAPELKEDEIRELQARPKLIVEARSADKLKRLFDKQLLHVAIVSRFQFPDPVEGNPATPRQWFDKRFQIVRAEGAPALPASGAE